MRVLHLNTERGFRGGEQQVLYLLHYLAKDVESYLACLPGEPLGERARERGIPVIDFPYRQEFSLAGLRALRRVVRDRNIDLVHAHSAKTATMAGLLRLVAPEVKIIVTRRVDFSTRRNPLRRFKYAVLPHRTIAISNGIREVLIADGIAPEAITVIPSGIDMARFEGVEPIPLRQDLGIPEATPLIGFVGALTHHKGVDVLLDAVHRMPKEMPWSLVIIGAGEDEGELRKQARAAGRAHVHFLGFREDVPSILRALDVFVLPSRSEGLGTSILDAMACELPVVGSRVGGIPEACRDGETGILVPPEDPEALAEALERLLADADLRRDLGGRGRQLVERRFQALHTAEETYRLYGELLVQA